MTCNNVWFSLSMLSQYDNTTSDETAVSRQKRATCGKTFKFSKAQKKEVLKVHNTLRKNEGGSDMRQLVSILSSRPVYNGHIPE